MSSRIRNSVCLERAFYFVEWLCSMGSVGFPNGCHTLACMVLYMNIVLVISSSYVQNIYMAWLKLLVLVIL
jgi:hypothetical protein